MINKYLFNILISIDQLMNTVFGGDPDETISSRVGKNYKNSELERFINFIFGEGHTTKTEEKDEGQNSVIK